LEQVVARDPDYARAWAGLADAYAVMAFHDHLPPKVGFPRAESAAQRAMRLDPALAAPHAALADVDTLYHWNWDSAERGFRRAIELEPTNATARQWYASLLAARGRFDEAERELRRASELDPSSMIAISTLGWVLMLANQEDRAIQQLTTALQLDPDFRLARYWMGLAYTRKGQPSEAVACLERLRDPSRGCPQVMTALAHAHAAAGNVDTSHAILDALIEREQAGRYISSYEVAKVYHALGDTPMALTRLERAFADRAHSMAFLKFDTQLHPLAGDPRVRALVEQVG
jgi:tetratricopeptide (TPR) repeat protein